METITVRRDDGRDLRFQGELVAEASSQSCEGDSQNRWCELMLYRTAGGKFVGAEIGRTRWQGETTRFSAEVCKDEDAVFEFFGLGRLSKELYSRAGIDVFEEVE